MEADLDEEYMEEVIIKDERECHWGWLSMMIREG